MKEKADFDKIAKDILSRRDPSGYYVVVAINCEEIIKVLSKYGDRNLNVEDVGNLIIVRGKARRVMEVLIRELIFKKLLADI